MPLFIRSLVLNIEKNLILRNSFRNTVWLSVFQLISVIYKVYKGTEMYIILTHIDISGNKLFWDI